MNDFWCTKELNISLYLGFHSLKLIDEKKIHQRVSSRPRLGCSVTEALLRLIHFTEEQD